MAAKPRLYCAPRLATGQQLALSTQAARHVQVLRLQPGGTVTLFDGGGGEFEATITRMGRSEVLVLVGTHTAVEREAAVKVHLALGVPANERMDWLVEKATELGVASIQPLLTERSVLRVRGERADKKRDHWQAIVAAACEQSGRNQLAIIHDILPLSDWLRTPAVGRRLLLSLQHDAAGLSGLAGAQETTLLSGPEGGLTSTEERESLAAGFTPVSLGPRTLRAETAPLAALAALTLGA